MKAREVKKILSITQVTLSSYVNTVFRRRKTAYRKQQPLIQANLQLLKRKTTNRKKSVKWQKNQKV